MYLLHLVAGRQLNDCDATTWYTDRVEASAKDPSTSKDGSFAARPAVSKAQFCRFVGAFSLRDEFTLLAVIGWISRRRVKCGTKSDYEAGAG